MQTRVLQLVALFAAIAALGGCSKSPAPAAPEHAASVPAAVESPVAVESPAEATPIPAIVPGRNAPPAQSFVETEPQPAKPRRWKTRTGTRDVEAAFIAWESGKVALKKADGKTVVVPGDKLSVDDQDYLRTQGIESDFGKKQIVGRVVGVTDGDTITVLDENNVQHKIRLLGIDAPETGQAFGTQSRKALNAKVYGKQVRIDWYENDRYGRVIGDVFVDDRLINKEMVQEGWAWHFKKYSHDPKLADAETAARDSRGGLWSDANPAAPWDYRHNEEGAKILTKQAPTNPAAIQPLVGTPSPESERAVNTPEPKGSARVESNEPKTVHVKGYTKKDGTYVAPHDRAAPKRRK